MDFSQRDVSCEAKPIWIYWIRAQKHVEYTLDTLCGHRQALKCLDPASFFSTRYALVGYTLSSSSSSQFWIKPFLEELVRMRSCYFLCFLFSLYGSLQQAVSWRRHNTFMKCPRFVSIPTEPLRPPVLLFGHSYGFSCSRCTPCPAFTPHVPIGAGLWGMLWANRIPVQTVQLSVAQYFLLWLGRGLSVLGDLRHEAPRRKDFLSHSCIKA